MTKFIYYDKNCHDGLKKKNISTVENENIISKYKILTHDIKKNRSMAYYLQSGKFNIKKTVIFKYDSRRWLKSKEQFTQRG